MLAGVAAMAGHWRPLFLGFARGGKIVATTGGVGLALAPLTFVCGSAVWIVVFLATRYASLASIPLLALCRRSRRPWRAVADGRVLAGAGARDHRPPPGERPPAAGRMSRRWSSGADAAPGRRD